MDINLDSGWRFIQQDVSGALSGSLILDWPFGTLQTTTNVTGPWNDVLGVTPPYTNATTEPQEFFRIKLQ